MNYKLILFYVVLGILILQYQNCAPNAAELAGEYSEDYSEEYPEADSERSVINQVQVGEIFFPQKAYKVDASNSVSKISGICEQEGSMISWTLRTEEGQLMERGLVQCDRGSFQVELSEEAMHQCEDLNLKAALGAKASSEMIIVGDCVTE